MRYVLLLLLVTAACSPQSQAQVPPITDSGGPLDPEQAAYDVRFYDLALTLDPAAKTIDGRLTVHAAVVQPLDRLVLDLDTLLAVEEATLEGGERVPVERQGGRLYLALGRTYQPGERVVATIRYGGAPRVAPRPPWSGGFTWATTPDGQPWIATSVQGEGADLWWPVKDHPSDEPDSMAIAVTVPAPLVVATNGRLRGVDTGPDGQRTYRWFVSTPINNYGVALNVAPYQALDTTYTSVTGEAVPVTFWVLPERAADGRRQLPQFLDHLAFYEELLGPYPFRADKYGVAHTPHLGMEHQTIIAYGSTFDDGDRGYDWLHHHELGHEWWGNLVTAFDWRDFWIHEGFCTYMQALYGERLRGEAGYLQELQNYRGALRNVKPVAPREATTTDQIYFIDVERGDSNNDIYYKGSWVLHTLRYLVGREALLTMLRRMAYPDPALERTTDGSAARFVSTQDFVTIAEAVAGRPLGWFFDVYVRQPALPRLVAERRGASLHLRWDVPGGLPFPMPVEVVVDGTPRRVELPEGQATLTVPAGAEVAVDPKGWVLKAE